MATPSSDCVADERLAAPQTSSKRATTMATYWRSVVGRASERLVVSAATAVDKQRDNQHDDASVRAPTGDHSGGKGDRPVADFVKGGDAEAVGLGGCETASSSGTMEEPAESPEQEDAEEEEDEPRFTLQLEPKLSTAMKTADVHTGNSVQWAYCDVLIQPDEYGLGLDLRMGYAPGSRNDQDELVVTVCSFRRLHAQDFGPAEASGKIQCGDVLWSIDGERVRTLEGVAEIISRRTSASTGFFFLRFLRPTVHASAEAEQSTLERARHNASTAVDPIRLDTDEQLRPDVAMLIRELVTRNQSLEEQVLASRLKQDEQRIQLDQLHALYANTQLENWSAFSLPKPFSRRAPSPVESSSSTSASFRGVTITAAAARFMGASAMQYDVEFAVNAERERLTQQFEQRLELEKKELEAAYNSKLAAMHATTDKKIAMLEYGLKELLTSPLSYSGQNEHAVPTEVSPHVQALRHQLCHRQKDASSAGRTYKDCLLCLLANELDVGHEVTGNQQDNWQEQLVPILDEYAAIKATRNLRLSEAPTETLQDSAQISSCGAVNERDAGRDDQIEPSDT